MSYSAPPPPGYGYGDYGYGGYAVPETSKKAIWSLVLGILSLLCCGIFAGVPAIVLGRMAKRDIEDSGGAQTGHGLATAGFVLGVISIVLSVLGLLGAVLGLFDPGSFSTSP